MRTDRGLPWITASVADYREAARRRLPPFLFEYVDGGSFGEQTMAQNEADLAAIALRQRVLRDVSGIDMSAELFGQKLAMPVILGPVGLAGLNARRGEKQAVRAAEAMGIPFTLSTVAACSLEETMTAATRPIWFQLYMIKDRDFMRDMLARVVAAGCSTLVFTVDMPIAGARYRDWHTGLTGCPGVKGALWRMWQAMLHPRWAWDVGLWGRPHALGNVAPVLKNGSGVEDFFAWLGQNFDPGIGWKDLDFIRSEWKGPLVLKGILDPEDAKEAVRMGADGIVVSNHGGRQLDGVLSSARALPRIADAVGDDLAVLADGGVRSGLDVVRMLALGAKAVMLGRAWAWALGAKGEAGVRAMLQTIQYEMQIAMSLTGVKSIGAIDRSIIEGELKA